MLEEKSGSVEGLLKQIEVFENTIKELENNVAVLKEKIKNNIKLYGPDASKWPATEK